VIGIKLERRKAMNENNTMPSNGNTRNSLIPETAWAIKRILASLVISAVLIGVAALIASSPAAASATEVGRAPQLEGTWRVTSTITGGPPPFSALYSFSGGGTVQESDETQLLTPSAGPALGVWRKLGNQQYAFTWESYLFDIGNNMPTGRLRVHGVITLQTATYTAVDQFEFYDTNGIVTFSGCAMEEAARMTVEPVTSCPSDDPNPAPELRSQPSRGWRNFL